MALAERAPGTAASTAPGISATLAGWSKGERAGGAIVGLAILCALLMALAPDLLTWPTAWTLPATTWIGDGLTVALGAIKPAARAASAVLGYPMTAANAVLTGAPWPAVFGAILALAWWIGGRGMAITAIAALGFVLLSGYWAESMSTLALVTVSVPLALSIGLGTGILAYEIPRVRRVVETVLDVMQTVPTFAYLTPLLLLFGFGPVVGLIASAIYAAPPMARNTLLGLQRVEAEVKEAALMSGATRLQRLFLVELPAGGQQILVGVNQCVMAALSMVIIAAVIGGFDDIGWEVLLTMRKAQFGQALLAGLVIVVFAILIDRMSAGLTDPSKRGAPRIAGIVMGGGLVLALLVWATGFLADTAALGIMRPAAQAIDEALSAFTAGNAAGLDGVKNGAMFYVLLPLRIGLDDAVLPFTWGFTWTAGMSAAFLIAAAIISALLLWSGRLAAAVCLFCLAGVVHTGITQLPWPLVIGAIAALAWRVGGTGLALFAGLSLFAMLLAGLWDRAMLSLYLCSAAVMICTLVGGGLGLLAAVSTTAWRVLHPVCDTLQTIPLFVFLIPMLMFFQIGEFSALLAICAYAIVPMIRYTRHGIINTPDEMIEAATASGATPWQILRDVRAPYAAPTILLGLNQTILYAFAMLVIAALIGTTGLGQSIYVALGKADVGLGVASGAAMALLALIADRMVQAFAAQRREALGL
ncbi:MAG: ABC transporter permease subunit [Pseudomonadota bacterium]